MGRPQAIKYLDNKAIMNERLFKYTLDTELLKEVFEFLCYGSKVKLRVDSPL